MMTFGEYIKDKILIMIAHLFGMIFLSGFLLATGNPGENIMLILVAWIGILFFYVGGDYVKRKKYFHELDRLLQHLDQCYLIGEVMEDTYRLEDKLYREVIRKSNKSVIEKIRQLEGEQQDYRDYIETWIHEVKAPITTMHLICENHKGEMYRKLQSQLSLIDNYVDMALFYARSEEVYKDFMIRPTNLEQTVISVLQKNKQYFMEYNVNVEIAFTEKEVLTDEKWLQFIINQILLNCVKYKKENGVCIKITTVSVKNAIRLSVEDNGIGIREHEIGRIFDKGFTGSNGRIKASPEAAPGMLGKSTGIGLYLCKKLCDKMELEITAQSVEGEFTRILLTFPKSNYFFI